MAYLTHKVDTATGLSVLIADSEGALPLTQATAFVDAGYTANTAPYFADYATAMTWVKARMQSTGAAKGNIVITSPQGECELESNVNVWVAPNVTIDSFSSDTKDNIFIDGFGDIQNLSIKSCNVAKVKAAQIKTAGITSGTGIYLEYNSGAQLSTAAVNGLTANISGAVPTCGFGDETRAMIYGAPVISNLTLTNNSCLRLENARVTGLANVKSSCMLAASNSEFYSTNSDPSIKSIGDVTLSDCWVYNGSTYCVLMNDQLQAADGHLILNDTVLFTNGNYSVCDGSQQKDVGIFVYGGSCANKQMLNCVSSVQTLTVDAGLLYKAF